MVFLTVILRPEVEPGMMEEEVVKDYFERYFTVTESPAQLNELFVEGLDDQVKEVFGLTFDAEGKQVAGPVVPNAILPYVESVRVDRHAGPNDQLVPRFETARGDLV